LKITYLKLVNYAGIWAGMDRTTFEADFTKGNSKIVLLFGKNGSGKTTILSALHPFMDSNNDNRTKLIMDGLEGYKEIHYEKDGHDYIIKHYYKSSNKSYIMKDGLELNDNGGIKTFKKIVEEELDVNAEYFKLFRIGSNVTNFIDLPTAQRKKFMGNFLPDIDEFLEYFATVKSKFSLIKKEVEYISDNIDKLDTEENLEILRESIESQIDMKQTEIKRLTALVNQAQGSIKTLDPDEKHTTDANPYEKKYNGSMLSLNDSKIKRQQYYSDYSDLSDFDYEMVENKILDIGKLITKFEDELSELTVESNKLKQELSTLRVSLNTKETSISDLESNESLNDLEKMKQEYQKKYDADSNYLGKNLERFSEYGDFSYGEIIPVSSTLQLLKTSLIDVKDNLSDADLQILHKLYTFDELTIDDLTDIKLSLASDITDSETSLDSLKEELSGLNSNLNQKDILDKRPSKCKIDECAFISNALQFSNIDEDIKSVEDKISDNKSNHKKILEQYGIIENVFNAISKLKKTLSRVPKDHSDILKKMDIISNEEEYVEAITASKQDILEVMDISDFTMFLKTKAVIDVNKGNLDNVNSKIKLVKKQSSVLKTLKKEKDDINSKIEGVKERLSEIVERKTKVKKNIEKKQFQLTIMDDLKTLFDKENEAQSTMDEFKQKYEDMDKLLNKLMILYTEARNHKMEYQAIELEVKPLDKQLKKVNLDISNLHEYEKRKAALQENFGYLETLKKVLDPTKGIPLHFIGNYLKETEKIANKLLDMAHNGRFRIKFELTSKDFFIKVKKESGDVLSDISIASQGEIALTTMSLSMAMIQQSLTSYNILYLDEIDGPLDTSNRRCFIDMIEEQIEELGLEQIFIISHNNEFDAYPAGLILLKNNDIDKDDLEFMVSKNIIFDIDDEYVA